MLSNFKRKRDFFFWKFKKRLKKVGVMKKITTFLINLYWVYILSMFCYILGMCVDTHVPRVQSAHFPMRASPINCCRYRRWLFHMWTFEFFPSNRLILKQGCLVERKKTSYQKTKEGHHEVPLWTIIENFNRKISTFQSLIDSQIWKKTYISCCLLVWLAVSLSRSRTLFYEFWS